MDWDQAERVLRYIVPQHLKNGTLGVLAASTNVPEGTLREYAEAIELEKRRMQPDMFAGSSAGADCSQVMICNRCRKDYATCFCGS